jgi:hypothetical protein
LPEAGVMKFPSSPVRSKIIGTAANQSVAVKKFASHKIFGQTAATLNN